VVFSLIGPRAAWQIDDYKMLISRLQVLNKIQSIHQPHEAVGVHGTRTISIDRLDRRLLIRRLGQVQRYERGRQE
jgi:hypothetical protein